MYKRVACPACGSVEAELFVRMDRRYLIDSDRGRRYGKNTLQRAGLDLNGDTDFPTYYECSSCGTYYLKELLDMETALAQDRPQSAPDHSRYIPASKHETYNRIEAVTPIANLLNMAVESTTEEDGLSVLDYGCGLGIQLGIMRSLGAKRVVGFEVNDSRFNLIRQYMQPGIELVYDPDRLSQLGPFDAVWCNQVMEHVFEPVQVVDRIKSLLKPGGHAYFFAPCVRRSTMLENRIQVEHGVNVGICHPGHVQIWNLDTFPLSRFVESRGFEMVFPKSGGTFMSPPETQTDYNSSPYSEEKGFYVRALT